MVHFLHDDGRETDPSGSLLPVADAATPIRAAVPREQCEVHPMNNPGSPIDRDVLTVPDVSVIMPVFNAADYVGEAIGSVLSQTISPERLELVIVDDGSTDGSDVVISELTRQDPRVTVLTQQNSGTPGGARNPGIEIARGTFLFFLDADDLLPEGSLERMVGVALEQDSDVVLGRLGSTDGRKVPSSMFVRTVLDADLVEDKVFNTLGPTKLVRRAVVERLQLRFPTDQTVGEDEPFMAAVYLNSARISVLADTDYYLTRYRADGANMTLAARDSASHAKVAMRVAHVVEAYTEPGPRRDALLIRPFGRPLARTVGGRWLSMDQPAREVLGEELRSTLGHLYSDRLRASLPSVAAAKFDLLMAGDLDGLATLIEHLETAGPARTCWDGRGFRRVVPAEIGHLFPEDLREVGVPKVTGKLEDLAVGKETVSVAVSLAIADFDGLPSTLLLRLRKRGADDVRDLESLQTDLSALPGGLYVRSMASQLPRGVWDLFAVLRFDDDEDGLEKEVRIGADRSRTIEPDGASNLAHDPPAEERLLAYFTKGYGNLSIDSGAVLHTKLALARTEGLTLDENGRALLLVRTSREPQPGDEFFADLSGAWRHAGRRPLPTRRLGERLIGLRLPLKPGMTGATLTVSSLLGEVPAPLLITGTEFWPERAAGFGLREVRGGGVQVVDPSTIGSSRADAAWGRKVGRRARETARRARHLASGRALSPAAGRLGATVKKLPFIGRLSLSTTARQRRHLP